MLVRTHDGAVNVVYLPVQFAASIRCLLHSGKDALPDAGVAPALEAAVHR